MNEVYLEANGVSKMFGAVRALNEINLTIGPGVTGLLGPNGSGKSTLLKLFAGQMAPDTGNIRVFGGNPVHDHPSRRMFGLCPEQDRFYEDMTGFEFTYSLTRLHGFGHKKATELTNIAIQRVGMANQSQKPIGSMSRGMRQRIKIAQAIAPQPRILLLDEPLTGTDPVGRSDLIALFRSLGEAGTCVLVSSHVLHEVEAMTDDVVFIRFGRLRARGNVFRLRTLLKDRPYRMVINVGRPRELGQRLFGTSAVQNLRVSSVNELEVTTTSLEETAIAAHSAASDLGVLIKGLSSPDADLESVYRYLVEGDSK